MDIHKARVTNQIIPPLLSSFKDYNSNLRTRLKANSLFLSFDEKSKKTFNKFIILSNQRFKLMKYGGNLNSILSNQRNNYTKINNEIKNDILYTTSYPNNERKKLIKGVNEFKSKEISSMREKLYETLRYHSIYDKKIKNHKLVSSEDSSKQKFQNLKGSKILNNRKKTNDMDLSSQIEFLQAKTEQEIKDDQIHFTNGLEEYKKFLKNKKNELNDVQNQKVIKIYKSDFGDIESHLQDSNIKILTYKTNSSENKNKKVKEDSKFDINILYKIKNYKKNKNKGILPKLISFEKESEETLKDKSSFSSNNSSKLNKNFNNTDLKNTIAIINEEARNSKDLKEKFDNQKLRFDKYFNQALGIIHHHNIESNKSNITQESNLEKKKNTTSKQLTKKTESENEKLFEDFLRIYEEKKKQWKKVDEENAKMKEKKEKEKEEVINYLFSLKKRERKKNF